MVVIPYGSFYMDSKKNSDENPQHMVYIKSFLMGKTEVTQKQWQDLMGSNPSGFAWCGSECPVEKVSWNDVQQFIEKLNQKTGRKHRLPTEAEWEYSARGGAAADWSIGNDQPNLGSYAWYVRNTGGSTQVVGQKLPNTFGLLDMNGNVWEWTQDCWHDTYAGAPIDGSAWTTGCSANYRVIRGGSSGSSAADLSSTYRSRVAPEYRDNFSGFRLARDL